MRARSHNYRTEIMQRLKLDPLTLRGLESRGFRLKRCRRPARYIQRRGEITQVSLTSLPYLSKTARSVGGERLWETARTHQYEARRVGSQITQEKLDALRWLAGWGFKTLQAAGQI